MQFRRRIKQLIGKMPLRSIFLIPFVIQILVIVGLTGYLSFRNGERAVNALATELQREIAQRIEERLNQYLTTPHLLNEIEANAIETGQIDLVDDVSLLPYFWKNLRIFPELNATFVGTEDGLMIGARRLTNRQIEVMLASPSTKQSLNYYVAQEDGLPGRFVEGAPDYDPRLRSWYTQALEIGRPHWSPIYLDFSTGMLVITAGRPLYGEDEQLIGVVGSAFQFEQVNDFLTELEVGQNGQTFIVERSGFLVGTSTDAPISKSVNNNLVRLEAIESTDQVQKEITLLLYEQFGDLHNINEQQNLLFTIDNEDYYTHISPIRDEYGLNWLVAVIIPTSDFMAEIQANNRTTFFMILLALCVAIFTSAITTEWVTRPLRQLRDSADAFSQGNWQHRVRVNREDELGDLVATFNQMADELENSFALLEQRVAERTAELAQAKNVLEVRVKQRTAELTAANEALKQSQKRYESMFHYVPIMLWEEDFSEIKNYLDQLKEQGIMDLDAYFRENPAEVEHCASLVKVLAVNQTTLEILQTDKETAISNFARFFGQTGFDVFHEEILELSKGRTQFEAQSNSVTSDGHELQIYVRLVIAPGHENDWSRILVSVEDITQRIKMENALRENEQRLKQAQYMAQMGNWEFDFTNGKLSWSEELFNLFERPIEAGPPSYDENITYYLPEDRERLQQQLQAALETGQEFSDTYRLKLPSGKMVYHANTIFPIKDETGRIVKLTGTAQDITERVFLEKQVQGQERLAAVGQLAAGIAHDFNNILSGITLYTDLLLHSLTDLSPKNHKRLLTIAQQAERATQLIQQILDFSRRSALVRTLVNILHPLQELLEILERTLPENIHLEFKYERSSYIAEIDATRFQQVFMNLAVNARDAMPDGGTLSIEVASYHLAEQDKPPVAEMEAGHWVRITVSDTGTGIEEDVLPRIFEPFFTTKPPGKGTGLGLAQVYGIITQHNGYIKIDSHPNQGTIFTIYLPLHFSTETMLLQGELDQTERGEGETILVVEDNESTREALLATLEMLNYRTLSAQNGREALEMLAEHQSSVAMIISDMLMPEMSGIELVAELRQQNQDIPIVILSGYLLEDDLETLRQLNVTGWLYKPPTLKQLASLLHKTLRSSTLPNAY